MAQRRMIVPPGMENVIERYRYAPGVLVGSDVVDAPKPFFFLPLDAVASGNMTTDVAGGT